jgi:hypothetical protein
MSDNIESTSVEDFSFGDPADDNNFFEEEIKEEESITEEEKKETTEKKEDPEEKKEETKTGEEEKKEDVSFNFDGEEEEIVNTDEPGQKEETVSASVSTANYLKEKGIVSFELEEGETLTPEKADEIVENKFEESVDNRLAEMLKELPPEVKSIVKFTANGGDFKDVIRTFQSTSNGNIEEGMDLEDEANQSTIVRQFLIEDGYDEDVEEQIEFLKEKGKLASIAAKKYKIWSEEQKEEKASVLAQQEEEKKKIKEDRKIFKSSLHDTLKDKTDLSGITLTDKDKSDLPNYISDMNIKLKGGGYASKMQMALHSAMQDKDKLVLLAKLLKSDFDFSDIEKAAITKKSKAVKDDVRRTKPSVDTSKKKNSRSTVRNIVELMD